MRLPLRSRPLLSFIRGTPFSSSEITAKPPVTLPAPAIDATTRPPRSLSTRPRLRTLHGGVMIGRRRVNARREADSATTITAPVAGTALTVSAPTTQAPMAEKDLKRRVWGLALPSIGEQLLSLGVGVSDTFLAGHLAHQAVHTVGYGRATAVASVGIASTAAWIVLTVFFAINIGVTALVARATGARKVASPRAPLARASARRDHRPGDDWPGDPPRAWHHRICSASAAKRPNSPRNTFVSTA